MIYIFYRCDRSMVPLVMENYLKYHMFVHVNENLHVNVTCMMKHA